MRAINYREKVMELEGVTNFREIKTEEGFTCKLTYKNMPWAEWAKYSAYQEKYIVVQELYFRLWQNLTMTPEERKVRQAINDAWMRNIMEGRADSRGEFIPSNKQIIDELKQNA
jgi:hypothetical protein